MKAAFFASAYLADQIPKRKEDKILIVGRSNVGKSSLINHLFQNSHLARISKKPGKTISLNFYLIDERFFLVDLPGYGFAKTAHGLKKDWGPLIDDFFQKHQDEIKLVLFLIDSRRKLNQDDLNFLTWIKIKQIPLLLIQTKCDKEKPSQEVKDKVKKELSDLFKGSIEYTIKQDKGRQALLSYLKKR